MSGSAGGNRITRESVAKTTDNYINRILKKFPAFKSAKISGSYNTSAKEDFGDIDLIVNLKATDKKNIKLELAKFLSELPDDVIIPFKSEKYKGKKYLNTGEIITILYPIEGQPDQYVQIDNIVSVSDDEAEFKKEFLDYPAEIQGLLLGLAKVICLEEDPKSIFARMGIKNVPELEANQEYEFNLSSAGLTLRIVTLDNFKEVDRTEVWKTSNWSNIKKLFTNYKIDGSFEDLLNDIASKAKNLRSKNRIKGIFNSMVSIKSGEVDTPKGDNKQKSLDKVNNTLSETNLGRYIASLLLEQDQPTIALYPGKFKPPHKGHFEVVKKLLQNADQVVVLISPKTHEGITADESAAIWELYKQKLDGNIEVRISTITPVADVYDFVENNPELTVYAAYGKGEEGRYKNLGKYPNAKIFDAGTTSEDGEDISATGLRKAIRDNNDGEIKKYLPDGIEVNDFLKALGKEPKEEPQPEVPPTAPVTERKYQNQDDMFADYVLSKEADIESTAQAFNIPIPDVRYAFTVGNMVVLSDDIWDKLENKNHKDEEIEISGPAMILNYDQDRYYLTYGSHILADYKKLGKTPNVLLGVLDLKGPKPWPLKEGKLNESETATIGEFVKYAIKNLEIQKPPRNLTFSYDNEAAKEKRSFGYFDPNANKIWVYCGNRNMADILRTLAHELVHRKQDEDSRLGPNSGDTGSPIENEANAMAGVLLRNFGKINNSIYEHKKMIKLKNILKEVQQLSIKNSIIFGVEHHSESDAQAVVDYVKKRYSPEDKVVFMGEGGDDNNKYVAGSEQEMIYDELNSYFNNLVNDSWDGSDLNVMNDQSLLYKIQKEKTGLSLSKILAANWASMVGQNIIQGQSIADFNPQDYLSPEGIEFLELSAKEAELPLSDNLYEPTAEDYDTLYRLSFPADNGDKYTKVAKIADAFNEARDENLLAKLQKYESKGYKVIATAGEGHIDLIKAMLKNKK